MQTQLIKEQTSLLNQIIEEVEKMDIEEKKKLLITLRKKEILVKAKSLDSVTGLPKSKAMTDGEAMII